MFKILPCIQEKHMMLAKTYAICTILTAELSEAMRHQFVFENQIALVPSTAMALQCFIQIFIATTWHE